MGIYRKLIMKKVVLLPYLVFHNNFLQVCFKIPDLFTGFKPVRRSEAEGESGSCCLQES